MSKLKKIILIVIGIFSALLIIGMFIDDQDNPDISTITKQSEQGNVTSQVKLGFMYYIGQNVKQDYSEAAKWYTKAADQGDAEAQLRLGVMYAHGYGVNKNQEKALDLYIKSANQKYPEAQYLLGISYLRGIGAPKNVATGLSLLEDASKEGFADADYILGSIYTNPPPETVRPDFFKGAEYLKSASDKGSNEAKLALAYLYLDGKGVVQDSKKSLQLLKEAADDNFGPAQNLLGYLYATGGPGISANKSKAKKYFKKSCENKIQDSCNAYSRLNEY